MNASTDIMGNKLLGIHGHPPRLSEPTLKEVEGAIPPIRDIGVRVWTANRFSGVDATFDASMANNMAGTPSPAEVAHVLPNLGSPRFDHEGRIGAELPILLLNFPTRGSSTNGSSSAPAGCEKEEDCCFGLDLPKRGDSHGASSIAACARLCQGTEDCAAYVFGYAGSRCWMKSAVRAAEGHNSTWASAGHCFGTRPTGPVPEAPPTDGSDFWEMSGAPPTDAERQCRLTMVKGMFCSFLRFRLMSLDAGM